MSWISNLFNKGGGKEREGQSGEIMPYVERYAGSLSPSAREAFYRSLENISPAAYERLSDGLANLMESKGRAIEIAARGQSDATINLVQNLHNTLQQERINPHTVDRLTQGFAEFVDKGTQAGERSLSSGQELIDRAIHNPPNRTVTTTEEYRRGRGANPDESQLKTKTNYVVDPKLPRRANAGRFTVEYPKADIYGRPIAFTSGDADAHATHNSAEAHSHGNSAAAAAGSDSIHIQGGNINVDGSTIEY